MKNNRARDVYGSITLKTSVLAHTFVLSLLLFMWTFAYFITTLQRINFKYQKLKWSPWQSAVFWQDFHLLRAYFSSFTITARLVQRQKVLCFLFPFQHKTKNILTFFFFLNQKYFWFGKLNTLLLATCLFMEININVYFKGKFKKVIQSIDFGIAFPHFLHCCSSIKYLLCVWFDNWTFLIKENVSMYNILTRKIRKFNTWNYETRELLYE